MKLDPHFIKTIVYDIEHLQLDIPVYLSKKTKIGYEYEDNIFFDHDIQKYLDICEIFNIPFKINERRIIITITEQEAKLMSIYQKLSS